MREGRPSLWRLLAGLYQLLLSLYFIKESSPAEFLFLLLHPSFSLSFLIFVTFSRPFSHTNQQLALILGQNAKKNASKTKKVGFSLCPIQTFFLFLPSILEVLDLFWHLRRVLTSHNAKTAYAEPKGICRVLPRVRPFTPRREKGNADNRSHQRDRFRLSPCEVGRESLYIERRLLRRLFFDVEKLRNFLVLSRT